MRDSRRNERTSFTDRRLISEDLTVGYLPLPHDDAPPAAGSWPRPAVGLWREMCKIDGTPEV